MPDSTRCKDCKIRGKPFHPAYSGTRHTALYAGNGIGSIAPLNIMHLVSPQSAILSAIIFNALIIVALIPLALRGVAYKPIGALAILQRNLLIYGLGGVIIPFIGIKLIDVIITKLNLI
jgi:K+-transporting ATPase ATPase B chain